MTEQSSQQQLALIPPQSEAVSIQVTNLNSIFRVIQEVQQQIVSLRDKAHVLTPMARTNLDPQLIAQSGRIPVLRVSYISTKKTDDNKEYVEGEIYDVKETGKVALTKIGLQRLDALAGLMNWKVSGGLVPAGRDPQTGATRYDSLHAKYTAYAEIEDIDGTIRNSEATYEQDLNDGTPQATKMISKEGSQKELIRARQNISALTETKAMNRVRRTLLGIQSGFRIAELAKPFVILKTIPAPLNMNDPFIRKLVIMKQTGVTSEMYDQALGVVPNYSAPAQIPETSGHPLVMPPPIDTTGVTVPELPPIDDDDDDPGLPQTPVDPEALRQAQFDRIEKLYKQKLGKSRFEQSPNKPPLAALKDEELAAIENRLKEYPDHNPV